MLKKIFIGLAILTVCVSAVLIMFFKQQKSELSQNLSNLTFESCKEKGGIAMFGGDLNAELCPSCIVANSLSEKIKNDTCADCKVCTSCSAGLDGGTYTKYIKEHSLDCKNYYDYFIDTSALSEYEKEAWSKKDLNERFPLQKTWNEKCDEYKVDFKFEDYKKLVCPSCNACGDCTLKNYDTLNHSKDTIQSFGKCLNECPTDGCPKEYTNLGQIMNSEIGAVCCSSRNKFLQP